MNNIGLHGKFERINEDFLNETFDAFALLEAIQKKYGKTDNDTIINEARDAKVAQVLGYNNINTDKHGWDAKAEDEEFLEDVGQQFGSRGQRQATAILEEARQLFAGGELSEEDQIAFLTEMQQLFLDSKQRAKKFTPIRYRRENDGE